MNVNADLLSLTCKLHKGVMYYQGATCAWYSAWLIILQGVASGNSGLQQGRMTPSNMMPINNSTLSNGGNMMPLNTSGGSPMIPMHNSMVPMQHLNTMQGKDAYSRLGLTRVLWFLEPQVHALINAMPMPSVKLLMRYYFDIAQAPDYVNVPLPALWGLITQSVQPKIISSHVRHYSVFWQQFFILIMRRFLLSDLMVLHDPVSPYFMSVGQRRPGSANSMMPVNTGNMGQGPGSSMNPAGINSLSGLNASNIGALSQNNLAAGGMPGLSNIGMNSMQGVNTSAAETSIIRPNSAAANGGLRMNIPNGMMSDPGNPLNSGMGNSLTNSPLGPSNLMNGQMHGQGLNPQLMSGQALGPQNMANGPMTGNNGQQGFPGGSQMGNMPVSNGLMGSMPMGSMPMINPGNINQAGPMANGGEYCLSKPSLLSIWSCRDSLCQNDKLPTPCWLSIPTVHYVI